MGLTGYICNGASPWRGWMALGQRRYIVPYMGWYHSTAQVVFATGPAPGGAGWRQVAAPTVRDTFAPAGCATFKAPPPSSVRAAPCQLPRRGSFCTVLWGNSFTGTSVTKSPRLSRQCNPPTPTTAGTSVTRGPRLSPQKTVNCQLKRIVHCQLSIFVPFPACVTLKHRRPRFRGTLKTGGGVFIELPAFPWPGRLWR